MLARQFIHTSDNRAFFCWNQRNTRWHHLMMLGAFAFALRRPHLQKIWCILQS